MQLKDTDLLIIGGGINGAGIAADAVGRGLSITLCEQNDLASGTSWKSSKLIHGGLRYLQYYEFRLVRKALKEREILLRKAPHIIRPLEFIMPYNKQLRPAWLIELGLFLYDHLIKFRLLPGSKRIKLRQHLAGKPLKENFTTGFIYSDCYDDDARLVVLNALQAKQLGATILPRTKFISAERFANHWQATLQDTHTGQTQTIKARALINVAGPWVDKVLQEQLKIKSKYHMTLVKGSHIVVAKFYFGNHAYILENTDKRVVFVIPFEERYCLIGTTDLAFSGDLENINIDPDEINYLCAAVKLYFKHNIRSDEIIWSFAGVRPLVSETGGKNLSAISRDYSFELNTAENSAPLLNIFGGKITTYRELAEGALALLKPYFPSMKPAWTATEPLPGGDIPNADFIDFFRQFRRQYTWLPENLAYRYTRNYGTCAHILLNNTKTMTDLGQHFGNGLYQREVEYLVNYEFAQTAEDILWRRTKLGLEFPRENIAVLENYLQTQHLAPPDALRHRPPP